MPLDTAARREAALIDTFGMITPDSLISESDRAVLVGQYGYVILVSLSSIQQFTLYIETAREVVTPNTYGMTIEPSRALNVYVERSRDIPLGLT